MNNTSVPIASKNHRTMDSKLLRSSTLVFPDGRGERALKKFPFSSFPQSLVFSTQCVTGQEENQQQVGQSAPPESLQVNRMQLL